MLPLLNIGLRAARTASGQVIRAMERLDLIHAENNDLKHYLTKVCIGAETAAAYEIQKLYLALEPIVKKQASSKENQKSSTIF